MIDYPVVIKKQKNTTFTNREKFLMEGSKQIKTRFITSLSTHKNYENNYSPFLNIIPSMYQEKSKPKFVQPSMRFKPRNDFERVYESLIKNNFSFENRYSKKIIKQHLEMEKQKKKKNIQTIDEKLYCCNEIKEDIINDNKSKKSSLKEKINDMKRHFKEFNLLTIQNEKTKKLHSDLHNKTYFKALENYQLFGTTMLNQKYKQISPSFYKYNNLKKNKFSNTLYVKDKNIKNFDTEQPIINTNSKLDFINFFNQSKYHNQNIFNSLEKADFFIDTRQPSNTLYDSINNNEATFRHIKEMAFRPNEDDNHINEYIDNDVKLESNKNVERIVIDGKEYLKTDFKNITKSVLEKCNITEKQIPNMDYHLYKGDGKLMCTNGLTLNEFHKKFGLKG